MFDYSHEISFVANVVFVWISSMDVDRCQVAWLRLVESSKHHTIHVFLIHTLNWLCCTMSTIDYLLIVIDINSEILMNDKRAYFDRQNQFYRIIDLRVCSKKIIDIVQEHSIQLLDKDHRRLNEHYLDFISQNCFFSFLLYLLTKNDKNQ